jgi:hypothetical protein
MVVNCSATSHLRYLTGKAAEAAFQNCCLATPTTGALDWAVTPSTRFLIWQGVGPSPRFL